MRWQQRTLPGIKRAHLATHTCIGSVSFTHITRTLPWPIMRESRYEGYDSSTAAMHNHRSQSCQARPAKQDQNIYLRMTCHDCYTRSCNQTACEPRKHRCRLVCQPEHCMHCLGPNNQASCKQRTQHQYNLSLSSSCSTHTTHCCSDPGLKQHIGTHPDCT